MTSTVAFEGQAGRLLRVAGPAPRTDAETGGAASGLTEAVG